MKKRLKLKKGFKIAIILIILVVVASIYGIKKYKQYQYEQTYEYKLTAIGYSLDEANLIQQKLDTEVIDEYLDKKKDQTLIDLLNEPYFIKKNLTRYLDYLKKYSKTSIKNTVTLVNVNRDYNYYAEIKKADLSKGNLLLVNKYYAVDENYSPDDLVSISSNYAWGTGHKIKQEVYDAFLQMWEDAYNNGIYLMINSSYRSYKEQVTVYDNLVETKNSKYADSIAARPGHSEHGTGLCLDIFSKANTTKASFSKSTDFEWLKNNSYKYGFILRYPEGKSNITGYDFESWHYRYVGKDTAKKIFDLDITFDEYYAYYLDN